MRRNLPVALTIAGSDSGGGAGIQADLKAFAALKVHGLSVITAVTAQSPLRVRGIESCSAKILRQQMEAVFEDFRPMAVKTGMLFLASTIRLIAPFFGGKNSPPLVVDPVMVSTSGKVLLPKNALKALCDELLPRATLVTPNVHEAEILAGKSISSLADLRTAAKQLHARFGCAVLVKGGHLSSSEKAVDAFFDGKMELLLSAARVRWIKTHGTGCTYSAAITAGLAHGLSLIESVRKAKRYVTRAIAQRHKAGEWDVLSW
jgi:hydroxymethylpyrimidine/phosphomethylpyrimidine kinase